MGGGAIFNKGTVVCRSSAFLDNTDGAIFNMGDLTCLGSNFTNNISGGSNGGGAIYNGAHGMFSCSGSTFTSNTAGFYSGGAIYNDGNLTCSSSNFVSNTAGGTWYSLMCGIQTIWITVTGAACSLVMTQLTQAHHFVILICVHDPLAQSCCTCCQL
eukprot:TRINITY_DN453_c0_g2_i3.p1 TRINITY_DN453_c0_g2~~TRINITY_DN453_c0_g2_i3.p1  ORF type:complete len:157 (-),score=15.35 TRINITY_DN453_c0_g2_i3:3010-3480(-)